MRSIKLGESRTQTSVLLTGLYNVGKTYLLGSALVLESSPEHPALFVHIGDEPSWDSIRTFDLSNVELITAEIYEDFRAIEKEYAGKGFSIVGIDSLEALSWLAEIEVAGGERAVGLEKGAGRSSMKEWAELKFLIFRALRRMQSLAPLLVATCPVTVKENRVTGEESVVPALPGQQAYAIFGRFAYAGYIRAVPLTPEKIRRTIDFTPNERYLTRWNASRPLRKPIVIPDGPDAWRPIREAIDQANK